MRPRETWRCGEKEIKWETGKGYPDISLLEPIANVFGISVTKLISGNAVCNGNVSANMMRSLFYVCPIWGNIFHGMDIENDAISLDKMDMVRDGGMQSNRRENVGVYQKWYNYKGNRCIIKQ